MNVIHVLSITVRRFSGTLSLQSLSGPQCLTIHIVPRAIHSSTSEAMISKNASKLTQSRSSSVPDTLDNRRSQMISLQRSDPHGAEGSLTFSLDGDLEPVLWL